MIIDDPNLGMQEGGLIFENADSIRQQILVVGPGNMCQVEVVTPRRHDEFHLNSAHGRQLDRTEHGIFRHEVWSDQPQALSGVMHHGENTQLDFIQIIVRTTGHDLNFHPACRLQHRVIVGPLD